MRVYTLSDGLNFGPMPKERDAALLERLDISGVMTLSKKRPPEVVQMLGEYRYCHIPDGKGIPQEQLDHAVAIVVKWLKDDRDVYIHCLAGRNRSALVAALAYREVYKTTGLAAFAAVKEVRPHALHNTVFEKYLKELP